MTHVKVTICTGTTCYVMGASELLTLEEHLPEDIRDHVEVVGAQCLNLCKEAHTQMPVVLLNDEPLSQVTLLALLAEVERRVRA